MRLHRFTNAQIAGAAERRPEGYLSELERHVVRRDEIGLWFDLDAPGYIEMMNRYAAARTVERAERCGNCGGQHATAKCPIPEGFDPKDFSSDSKGTAPCNCA